MTQTELLNVVAPWVDLVWLLGIVITVIATCVDEDDDNLARWAAPTAYLCVMAIDCVMWPAMIIGMLLIKATDRSR